MSDIQHIPLNKLVESEDNVRRTERKRDIDALAASIAAHGLLQNLTVTERDAGKYAVVAGARRHAALKLLVRQGERAKDWPVPAMSLTPLRPWKRPRRECPARRHERHGRSRGLCGARRWRRFR
ncbi:MAG: ParB N-terminal domain-containing protein [Caulobacteraceae bacterium]|nr:ParB N-terminal domain-containing protein [Caulobacteraceae bacterium]